MLLPARICRGFWHIAELVCRRCSVSYTHLRALIAAKIKQTAVVAPILSNPVRTHYLAALVEGLVLGGYQFTECKGKPEAKPELDVYKRQG